MDEVTGSGLGVGVLIQASTGIRNRVARGPVNVGAVPLIKLDELYSWL